MPLAMIEIDHSRYTKISRKNALALLEQAELTPDKFIAHKDKTFTAKFRRKRKSMFQSQSYEERIENAGEHRIAILKRPSVRMDRGPYMTMRFAFAALETLGLDKAKFAPKTPAKSNGRAKKAVPVANGKAKELVDPFAAIELTRMAHDVQNLTREAHKLAKDPNSQRAHLLVILEELEKHVDDLIKNIK
ncbi:MAG: hypothetical protein U0694_21520 [Anaerolineae bacterium]